MGKGRECFLLVREHELNNDNNLDGINSYYQLSIYIFIEFDRIDMFIF